METIKLSGIELLALVLLDSGNAYKAGSKLEGQTYSRYVYNNKVFIVNDKSQFVADFKAGKVKQLTLTPSTMAIVDAEGNDTGETASTIQFGSYYTHDQWAAAKKAEREEKLEDAKFDGKLATIRSIDYSTVNAELLAKLEAVI